MVAAPSAKKSVVYHVATDDKGAATITVYLHHNQRLVADKLVVVPASFAAEKAAGYASRPDRFSCLFASAAPPFSRLRRFAADGRQLWEWNVANDQQALRFLAVPGHDCLSPDGKFMTVTSYRFDQADSASGGAPLGNLVIAVGEKPRFVDARGAKTGELFGHPRFTGLIGWRAGFPATLEFEVNRDLARNAIVDTAILSPPAAIHSNRHGRKPRRR